MQIPKTFQLGGLTFKVIERDDMGDALDGLAVFSKPVINLSSRLDKEYKDFVFCHELVHQIFNAAAETKLRDNEVLVDRVATFLLQYLKTAK